MNFNQPIGTFDTVTIDTWIKWHSTTGNHPIMNEDNWAVGDLHYQIYNSEFGFDVHGRGGDSGDTNDYSKPNGYSSNLSDLTDSVLARLLVLPGPVLESLLVVTAFNWQPSIENWYFISITYKSSEVSGRTIGGRQVRFRQLFFLFAASFCVSFVCFAPSL